MVLNILLNSTNDLNIFSLGSGLIDQSPIAAFGYAARAIQTLQRTAVFIATGEYSDAGRGVAKFTGAGKSYLAVYDTFNE
jgi:hypothetical protein